MEKIIDFYIKNPKMKDYDREFVENNHVMDIIISKIQIILFTNKGEILGDPDFGCDIPSLLWNNNIDAGTIEAEINEQVMTYAPEAKLYGFNCIFYILPGTVQDIGIVEIDLDFTTISALFK